MDRSRETSPQADYDLGRTSRINPLPCRLLGCHKRRIERPSGQQSRSVFPLPATMDETRDGKRITEQGEKMNE